MRRKLEANEDLLALVVAVMVVLVSVVVTNVFGIRSDLFYVVHIVVSIIVSAYFVSEFQFKTVALLLALCVICSMLSLAFEKSYYSLMKDEQQVMDAKHAIDASSAIAMPVGCGLSVIFIAVLYMRILRGRRLGAGAPTEV